MGNRSRFLINVILFRPFRAINVVRNLTQGVALGYYIKLFQSKMIVYNEQYNGVCLCPEGAK